MEYIHQNERTLNGGGAGEGAGPKSTIKLAWLKLGRKSRVYRISCPPYSAELKTIYPSRSCRLYTLADSQCRRDYSPYETATQQYQPPVHSTRARTQRPDENQRVNGDISVQGG